ncbi:MAG: InlB B-repeat-containing protein [Methanimicrococcus sp.]|nr:InlB B-repeat-containing protein [Methanimicrococcus sp.]
MNKNGTFQKTIHIAIAIAVALTLLSGFAMTAYAAAPDITVSNEAELIGAVNAAPAGPAPYTIALKNDIELTDTLTIPVGKNILLINGDGGPFSLIGAEDRNTILVKGKLTLGTTNIDGIIVTHKTGEDGRGVYVDNGGVLIMNSGEISGNSVKATSGGGVYVHSSGVFEIYGGTIANNSVTMEDSFIMSGGGGGVYTESNFEMAGGTITNNTVTMSDGMLVINGGGGGVFVNQSFTMTGGAITNNTFTMVGLDLIIGGGGGVFAKNIIITDGMISNNNAFYGGGVSSEIRVTMNGGTIENNIASHGGGVFATNFTMTDGMISNNVAINNGENALVTGIGYGGGVFAEVDFIMTGGTIENNTAAVGGGAVVTKLVMTGGTIANNTAIGGYAGFGGGVAKLSNGASIMKGGTITNNTASYGGGLYVFNNYTTMNFTMTGGTISDNVALANGGGVWINNANQSLSHFVIPADAVDVVFSNNRAYDAYHRDPADDDAYAMYIAGDVTWSEPFTQGYNNYDISYAIGEPLPCVSFDTNAGDDTVKGLIFARTLLHFEEPYGKLSELSRDGYTFEGWFTEAEGGEKVVPSTVIMNAASHVLYAQWTEIIGGGDGGDGGDSGDSGDTDSGSGFGQAVIVNSNDDKNVNNNTEQNNSGSDKKPAPPAKGTNGGDSADSQNTSTGGIRGALFWVMVLLTAPAIAAGFTFYKNKGKV